MQTQETAYKRFSTALVLCGLILVSLIGFVSPASAGPFHISLPIEGLEDENLPAIKELFGQRFGRKVQHLVVKDGMLEFYAGGESAHAILRLEEVIDAVEAAGLAVDMSSWLLKPQEVGVYVVANSIMTASQLEKAIESFDNATVKVMGILLDENRMCVVLHFSREIDYAAFDRTLKETGILIRGLCWGHWKYGWSFELEGEA